MQSSVFNAVCQSAEVKASFQGKLLFFWHVLKSFQRECRLGDRRVGRHPQRKPSQADTATEGPVPRWWVSSLFAGWNFSWAPVWSLSKQVCCPSCCWQFCVAPCLLPLLYRSPDVPVCGVWRLEMLPPLMRFSLVECPRGLSWVPSFFTTCHSWGKSCRGITFSLLHRWQLYVL